MDGNKKAKLEEIGYCIVDVCGNCRHGVFNVGHDFGTCALFTYIHVKHTGEARQLSIHRYDECGSHASLDAYIEEARLGTFVEFRHGAKVN